MAKTVFDASQNAGLIREALAIKAFQYAESQLYFDKQWQSSGPNTIITVANDLLKESGDVIRVRLLAPLTGEGQVDDATLEGEEEALAYYQDTAQVHQRRHATRVKGKMTEQRTKVPLRSDGRTALGNWMAQLIDTDTVLAMSGVANATATLAASAPTTNRIFRGGQKVSGTLEVVATDALIDSDTDNLFGTLVISWCRRKAVIPGAGYPKIRPVRYKGQDYWIMFIHPYQAKALKGETAWIEAQRQAGPRDMSNPLFSGMLGIWDQVVIKEFDKIEMRLGDGTGTDPTTYFESGDACANGKTVARGLFCGAQAASHCWAQKPDWNEKSFDYGNQWGIATGMIWTAHKNIFNGEDYGMIAVDTIVIPD